MPRKISIWKVVKGIKLLRLHGYSSGEIGDLLREDIVLRESSQGNPVEILGDKEIINYAYSEDLNSHYNPRFVQKASGIFYGDKEGGGKKNG